MFLARSLSLLVVVIAFVVVEVVAVQTNKIN